MLTAINKLFVETLKLTPEVWTIVLVAVVGVAFLVPLIIGLLVGDFAKSKAVMGKAISVANKPEAVVNAVKGLPPAAKQQYVRARAARVHPSDFVTEDECVNKLYRRSLISKVWIITFVATAVCAAIAFLVMPIACQALSTLDPEELKGIDMGAMANSQRVAPITVLLVGGLLTLVGAIVGCLVHSSARGVYAKFARAIDGDGKAAPAAQPPVMDQPAYAQPSNDNIQFAAAEADEPQSDFGAQPVDDDNDVSYASAEPQFDDGFAARPQQDYAEPVVEPEFGGGYSAAEPVAEDNDFATPVMEQGGFEPVTEPVVDDTAEREAAEAAEREAAARAAAEAAERAAAEVAERAAAEAAEAAERAAAEAAARAAAEAAQAAQAAQPAAPTGTSSADDVIARIEKIDREGAPRETMREVATLLQKERAKPENKTPEQQKKLNEALSKLLKAMSAANRK